MTLQRSPTPFQTETGEPVREDKITTERIAPKLITQELSV